VANPNDITNPIYQDADKARAHLEAIRWPNGPVCPHCGTEHEATKLEGKAHRKGLYQCNACREQFTVTVGTVFERSRVPLNKWLLAVHLMAASKKGYSAHQLHRTIGVTYKTAWFMFHRIREAMREGTDNPMGGGGGTVEADETFWGNTRSKTRSKPKGHRGYDHKEKIVSLVERGGRVRSFHVPSVNAKTVAPILRDQMAEDANLMTDESSIYTTVGREFASHQVVSHGIREYVRGVVHTNTIEGFFSIFKRGLNGIYHHVSPEHLKRYACEFDFRYNYRVKLGYDDAARAEAILRGIQGKRLTYRRPDGSEMAGLV
jgi:transposase-like protein